MSSAGDVTEWVAAGGWRRRGGPAVVGGVLPPARRPGERSYSTCRRAADEEDVALSAFDSFCRGAEQGRFPQLDGRDDLWHLLVVITVRKKPNNFAPSPCGRWKGIPTRKSPIASHVHWPPSSANLALIRDAWKDAR